ncbi:hypothetical protein N5W20_00360 [Candidatus Kirkpatrickella diaphorinae]|uniref:Transposase n=1 Tax=Candidatus Kirkpatrickella diaphorinae TaxID=2984322 RepID=A0ABY6GL41_9PROT|nr:hypothetical protein [Candidatus Kirkpatrickella diaphorinae]UYH51376.1 hypothetical protein N5W20_00360 [Candidatus Kirkpatrickella diaphorinae]
MRPVPRVGPDMERNILSRINLTLAACVPDWPASRRSSAILLTEGQFSSSNHWHRIIEVAETAPILSLPWRHTAQCPCCQVRHKGVDEIYREVIALLSASDALRRELVYVASPHLLTSLTAGIAAQPVLASRVTLNMPP